MHFVSARVARVSRNPGLCVGTALMAAINLWMQQPHFIPPTWARTSPHSQGCIQEDSIIIISTLAAAKIWSGFYIYSKVSFSLSLIPENSLRQVGARGSLASSER